MPELTLTITTDNLDRLVPAIDARFTRQEDEGLADFVTRWIRWLATDWVHDHESRAAGNAVDPDGDIVT